jgi:hypothetical protein
MSRTLASAAILALICLATPRAYAQAVSNTSVITVPISNSLPGGLLGHPCGTGDVIQLSGNMHIVTHTNADAAGGFHYKVGVVTQNITGIGLVSGTRYRLIRTSNIIRQETIGAQVIAEVNGTNKLVAHGRAENVLIHSLTHMTFNANGELTSSTTTFRASCEIIS